MVALTGTAEAAGVYPAAEGELIDSAGANASIAAYVGAGERMLTLMDITWKVCALLAVLVALGWVLGLLPGAVKLF
jgi:hypothetical protein